MVRVIPPAPVKSRTSARSAPSRSAKSTSNVSPSADADEELDLVQQMANKLVISQAGTAEETPSVRRTTTPKRSTLGSSKPTAGTNATPAERAVAAMKRVNLALHTLASINKTGWKASNNPSTRSASTPSAATSLRPSSASSTTPASIPQYTRLQVEEVVMKGSQALLELRGLIKSKQSNHRTADIEKAAGSLVANVVELELYRVALQLLSDMRDSIISTYMPTFDPSTSVTASTTPLVCAYLINFPLPDQDLLPSTRIEITELLPLVLAVQQYSLGCLLRLPLPASEAPKRPVAILDALTSSGHPLDWRLYLDAAGDGVEEAVVRKIEAMMTSMFGAITKGCVGLDSLVPDPNVLLLLRVQALLLFASTRSLYTELIKLEAFYDQLRKVILLFGRQAEQTELGDVDINARIKFGFETVVHAVQAKGGRMEGKAWLALCEVVLHVAKRAKDVGMVETVVCLMNTADASDAVDAETLVSQSCSKLVSATTILENYRTTQKDTGVSDHVRRITITLPALSRLRTSVLAPDLLLKIDRSIERLRRVVTAVLRGDKRSEELLTKQAAARVQPSVVDCSIVGLLETLVKHAESVASSAVDKQSGLQDVCSAAVESLVLLAYHHLVVDDRLTYVPTYAYFERALPLLGVTAHPNKETVILWRQGQSISSLRALTSTLYNIGGILYNASKPESAIKFILSACSIGQAILALPETGIDACERLVELQGEYKRVMSKRWELLALCYHGIGEKRLAYEAYNSAILSQAHDGLLQVGQQSSTSPISVVAHQHVPLFKLVQRSTRLAVFDLLLQGGSTSLRTSLAGTGCDTTVAATAVELQIYALEGTLYKPEAVTTVGILLEELLCLYDPILFPLRRARTLVRRMQHQCTAGNVQDLSLAAAAAEIDQLCSTTSWAQDDKLQSFAPQCLAFSHLWLGFHSHQAGVTGAVVSSGSTASEARQALKILRDAFDGDMPASPSVTLKTAVAPTPDTVSVRVTVPTVAKRRTTTRAAVAKTPLVSRTLPSRIIKPTPVTPPSRASLVLGDRQSTPRKQSTVLSSSAILDNPDLDYDLLENMAHLLGALGYSLLRISYLKFLRRLSIKRSSSVNDSFIVSSSHLASEYLQMGKATRAGVVFAQAAGRLTLSSSTSGVPLVSDSAKVMYLSRYAEYLAVIGHHDKSAAAYEEALIVSDAVAIKSETATSASARIIERTILLQTSAVAAGICSVILQHRGDLARALVPAMQALRIWTRALGNVSRLSARETVVEPMSFSPSSATAKVDPLAPLPDVVTPTRRRQPISLAAQNGGLVWSLADSLASALLRVSHLYSIRGTPKSAEHYATQAVDLARDLGSPRVAARAYIVRGEVKMKAGNLVGCEEDMETAVSLLGTSSCPETINAGRLRADLYLRCELAREAHVAYIEAQSVLDQFAAAAGEGEVQPDLLGKSPAARRLLKSIGSPASPGRSGAGPDRILPTIYSHLLRMRVSLLRTEGKLDESQSLLQVLSKLKSSDEDKAGELMLLASIRFQDLVRRFGSDPVLGMLQESTFSIPALGLATAKGNPRSAAIIVSLQEIEDILSKAMSLSLARSSPAKLREISLQTASLKTLQTSIGKYNKRAATDVASILDAGVAVTLRRDMLDAIDHRLNDSATQDDISWPRLVSTATSPPLDSALAFWSSVRGRYEGLATAASNLTDPTLSERLPSSWTVISLHLSANAESLVLARHRLAAEPLIFQLPLDRLARREGEEDAFSYEVAFEELKEIIAASNEGTQSAKRVDGKEERVAWWTQRKDLDAKLKLLLENMEQAWLGAFKSVLADPTSFSVKAAALFKGRIDTILKRSVTRDSKPSRLKLDDVILDCLAALPPTCRDEDIEDMFYFMTESFQFTGVPVAYDEIDLDQVVCDMRTALEELHGEVVLPPADRHTFLVLDKSLQSFPWESIPCLRSRSVSRIPSISFLHDRLDLAAIRSPEALASHEIIVDSSQTSYILNPGGDLKKTQSHFEPWLQSMEELHGWKGVAGRVPSEDEVRMSLSSKELFLYFGHGGAEQFIRSQTIRHLPRCAVTMLWGCSSGLLKDQADFDPIGTPYHYMIAGCPALVANLWDVTDKDIDQLSATVLAKLGLDPAIPASSCITLTDAIATSRDVCNLKYLNGAAPVVYGVPVRFVNISSAPETK